MKRTETVFLVLVFIFAAAFLFLSASKFIEVRALHASAGHASGTLGKPRDVDMQKIRGMIRRNELSDREALFYKKGAPEALDAYPAPQADSTQ